MCRDAAGPLASVSVAPLKHHHADHISTRRHASNERQRAEITHGLRKAGATRDANRGWSESELEAKCGWCGGRMALHDTRTRNRENWNREKWNREKLEPREIGD